MNLKTWFFYGNSLPFETVIYSPECDAGCWWSNEVRGANRLSGEFSRYSFNLSGVYQFYSLVILNILRNAEFMRSKGGGRASSLHFMDSQYWQFLEANKFTAWHFIGIFQCGSLYWPNWRSGFCQSVLSTKTDPESHPSIQ